MAPRNNDSSNSQGAEAVSNDVAKAEIDKKYHEENQKNKITAPFLLPYPEPEEVRDQVINLADLEEPPSDFEIPGLTSRNPIMPNSYALVRFHFWNINPGRLQNGETRLKAFRKLFYNQDEGHGVRSIDDLCDLKRDSGPRLLKPAILRRLNISPISRHYPDYTRDTDWEEQRLRPPLHIPIVPANHTLNARPDIGEPDSLVQEETPPHLNTIRETLERLLIQLRYHELEVPQTESSSAYRRCLPPEKVQLFLDTNHSVDRAIDGMEYISHERGLIGDINDGSKTRFDCILMAGKFLDAGLTRIDLEEFGSSGIQETHSHQTFVSMIKYDITSSLISKRLRNTLHQFCQELAPTSFTDLLSKVTILRRQFYFSSIKLSRCENGHERPMAEKRGTLISLGNDYTPEKYTGFNMQEVLQSMFQQCIEAPFQRDSRTYDVCDFNHCNKAINQVFLRHSMPLRLAVSLPPTLSPPDHTSENIRIEIFNEQGEKEVVVYRWLGGIYSDTEVEEQNTHYRVYWTDSVRGEKPTKNIRMYDPRYAEGRVIEGIAPSQRGQIPEAWWSGKFKPVLFYERVLNPNPLDVTLAAAVLGDIHHAIRHDKLILQVHEPWKPITPGLNPVLPPGRRSGELDLIQGMPSVQVNDQNENIAAGNSHHLSGPHISARQAQPSTYQLSQPNRFIHSDNRGYLSNGVGSSSSAYSPSLPTTIGNDNLLDYSTNILQTPLFSNNQYRNSYVNTSSQRLHSGGTVRGFSEPMSLNYETIMGTNSSLGNFDNSAIPNMATNGEPLNAYSQNMSLATPGILGSNHNYSGITTTGINSIALGAANPSQSINGIYTGSQISNPVQHSSGSAFPNVSQEISLGLGGLNQNHSNFHGASHPNMELGDGTEVSFTEHGNRHSVVGQNASTASTSASSGFRHPVQTARVELSMKRGPETGVTQPPDKRIRPMNSILRN